MILVVVLIITAYTGWRYWQHKSRERIEQNVEGVELPLGQLRDASRNYGAEISRLSKNKGLSYEYLMALIVLECSGRKPAGSRFERHVYGRLEQLRAGERSTYEDVTQGMLTDASDEALTNLATSWGPFQLMGYKCVGMGVNVAELRDAKAVEWSVKWIHKEYGWLLKSGRYKDAFHYHNTGRIYPRFGKARTHDPRYVDKGLAYMEYFRDNP